MLLRSRWPWLAFAFAFLGTSAVLDTVPHEWSQQIGDWQYYAEDAAKWLGIVCWCTYHVGAAAQRAQIDLAVRQETPIPWLARIVPRRVPLRP